MNFKYSMVRLYFVLILCGVYVTNIESSDCRRCSDAKIEGDRTRYMKYCQAKGNADYLILRNFISVCWIICMSCIFRINHYYWIKNHWLKLFVGTITLKQQNTQLQTKDDIYTFLLLQTIWESVLISFPYWTPFEVFFWR